MESLKVGSTCLELDMESSLGETAERRAGAQMGFSERYNAILS